MNLDTPTIAIIVAIGIFYLKLAYLQWRKARGAAQKANLALAKARKQGKTPKAPEKPAAERFSIQVVSWYLVGGTMVLVILGLALRGNPLNFSADIVSLWWVPVAAGIVGLAFAIK